MENLFNIYISKKKFIDFSFLIILSVIIIYEYFYNTNSYKYIDNDTRFNQLSGEIEILLYNGKWVEKDNGKWVEKSTLKKEKELKSIESQFPADNIYNTTWLIVSYDIEDSIWPLTMTFHPNGTFSYTTARNDSYNRDIEIWTLSGNNIYISINDGYLIHKGQLNSDNYMEGTYSNKVGLTGAWYGTRK